MKKLNIITLLVLCITVVGTLTFASCSDTGKASSKVEASSKQNFIVRQKNVRGRRNKFGDRLDSNDA